MSNGRFAAQKSGLFHGVRDVGTTFFPECSGNAPVVFALCERKTVFKFDDPGDLFAPGMIVRETDNGAVIANERPDAVFVFSPVLDMPNRTSRCILKAEFALICCDERLDD